MDELRRAKMIGREAPLAYRRAELRWLQEQYGLSEVFVPGIVADMMEAANDGGNGKP